MNYLLLSQKEVERFYIYNQKNKQFHLKMIIFLAFFTIPVLPAFSDETGNKNLFKLSYRDNFQETYTSNVSVLSSDGTIMSGHMFNDEPSLAKIWLITFDLNNYTVSSRQVIKNLSSAQASNSSHVSALSDDGTIAGGHIKNELGNNQAAIWTITINDRETYLVNPKYLGVLNTNNPTSSEVRVLSANGNIAGGSAQNESMSLRAVIWTTNNNWKTAVKPIDLGTLKKDNSGFSGLKALSADGNTAAGLSSDYGIDEYHAVIWTTNDNWKTAVRPIDLGTLKKDNSGLSEVLTLSANGNIAGGGAQNESMMSPRAVIWITHDNWKTPVKPMDLNTLKTDRYGQVNVLSDDGQIAAGWASPNTGGKKAVIWFTNDDWKHVGLLDLGTLRTDHSGSSEVSGLSSDGTTIIGTADTDYALQHTFLKRIPRSVYANPDSLLTSTSKQDTDASHNSAPQSTLNSEQRPLSSKEQDKILPQGTGESVSKSNDLETSEKSSLSSSTIPQKNQQDKILPQGTGESVSKSNDLETSEKSSLSSSTIPQKNQQGKNAAPRPQAPSRSAVSNLEPHKSSKINKDKGFVRIPPMLDVINTLSTISKLASDTFSMMAFQRQTLTRLQQGCISTNGYWCWSVNANTSNDITKDIVPGINVGYGLTEKLSIGGVIEHAFSRSFPDSHEMNGNNIGLGFYAQWHLPFSVGESYLRPAVSFSQYDLGIKRSKLSNTEEGKGNSKMNGFGLSIEGGQNFILSNKMLLGWHAGVRYSQLSRNRYKENQVDYPIEYKKINYDNTSGYVGADVSVPILSPLSWVSGIEIEHTLKESELIYHAQLDKIENLSIKAPLNHTRGIVKTGLVYKLHKHFSVSVLTSLSQTTVGDKKWNTVLSLSGQF